MGIKNRERFVLPIPPVRPRCALRPIGQITSPPTLKFLSVKDCAAISVTVSVPIECPTRTGSWSTRPYQAPPLHFSRTRTWIVQNCPPDLSAHFFCFPMSGKIHMNNAISSWRHLRWEIPPINTLPGAPYTQQTSLGFLFGVRFLCVCVCVCLVSVCVIIISSSQSSSLVMFKREREIVGYESRKRIWRITHDFSPTLYALDLEDHSIQSAQPSVHFWSSATTINRLRHLLLSCVWRSLDLCKDTILSCVTVSWKNSKFTVLLPLCSKSGTTNSSVEIFF